MALPAQASPSGMHLQKQQAGKEGARQNSSKDSGQQSVMSRFIALHSQQCCLRPRWRRRACTAFLTEGCAGTTICGSRGTARAQFSVATGCDNWQQSGVRAGDITPVRSCTCSHQADSTCSRRKQVGGDQRGKSLSCVQRRRSRPAASLLQEVRVLRRAGTGAERQRTRARLANSPAHTASSSSSAHRDRMAMGVPVETANAGEHKNEQMMLGYLHK
jgi:hypothetical protein